VRRYTASGAWAARATQSDSCRRGQVVDADVLPTKHVLHGNAASGEEFRKAGSHSAPAPARTVVCAARLANARWDASCHQHLHQALWRKRQVGGSAEAAKRLPQHAPAAARGAARGHDCPADQLRIPHNAISPAQSRHARGQAREGAGLAGWSSAGNKFNTSMPACIPADAAWCRQLHTRLGTSLSTRHTINHPPSQPARHTKKHPAAPEVLQVLRLLRGGAPAGEVVRSDRGGATRAPLVLQAQA
jgi:hypothetical protein